MESWNGKFSGKLSFQINRFWKINIEITGNFYEVIRFFGLINLKY